MKLKILILLLLIAIPVWGAPMATPTLTSVTSSGSVAAGYSMVSMATSSTFVGTILGTTASASTYYTFPQLSVGANYATYGAIAYTISAGNIQILTVSAQ